MTRHESITSSPSSIGPMIVLLIILPHLSAIIGLSGKTRRRSGKEDQNNFVQKRTWSEGFLFSWTIEFLLSTRSLKKRELKGKNENILLFFQHRYGS
jgi:hypothetical protein